MKLAGDDNPNIIPLDEEPRANFLLIPLDVIYRDDLTDKEKILVGLIFNLSRTSRGCFASNEYFAKYLHTTKSSVKNSLSRLYKKKIIHRFGTKTERSLVYTPK